VLDTQPGRVSANADQPTGVAKVLHTVSSIPLPVPSREWLYQHLQGLGFTAAMQQWLGSNLVPDTASGKFVWAFDIQVGAAPAHSPVEPGDEGLGGGGAAPRKHTPAWRRAQQVRG
jgi:hypothetical protein